MGKARASFSSPVHVSRYGKGAFGQRYSWNIQDLWYAKNVSASRMLLWSSATAPQGSPTAMGSCLVCRQEQFLAQPPALVLGSGQLLYMSFSCSIYFPQTCSGLHSPQQGISEISVIIYHFVLDRISLESICLKKKKKSLLTHQGGLCLLFSPCI